MFGLTLRTRILVAGVTLVLAVLGSGLWSTAALFGLAKAVDESIRDSQKMLDLIANLSDSLEREDDALLLSLSGSSEDALIALTTQRRRGDQALDALRIGWQDPSITAGMGASRSSAASIDTLRQRLGAYRHAGDTLLMSRLESSAENFPEGLNLYHRDVNPLLRQSIAVCETLRVSYFQAMEQAALLARDQARVGTWRSMAAVLFSLFCGVSVATWLAHSILQPVQQFNRMIAAVQQGNFQQRVSPLRNDELGSLGQTLNQMASSLEEYRQSSLGELLESKATLSATLQAIPAPVLMFAADGNLLEHNPPAQDFLNSLAAGDASSFEDRRLPRRFREAVHGALSGQLARPSRLDFGDAIQVPATTGLRRWLISASPVQPLGEQQLRRPVRSGAVIVLEDVTDIANLDELRGELIGVASHELKSPLTTLRMNLAMLSETAERLDDRQRELLEAAERGCDELEITIEELLDVTRVEAGKLSLNADDIHLQQLVAAVVEPLQDRFHDAAVSLRLEAPAEPLVLKADGKRLASVLTNLLTNSLNYAPPKSDVLVVLKHRHGANGGCTEISVEDQGPGIPAAYQERVFEKFFRIEHQGVLENDLAQPKPSGTGIGLYLCREIVRAHGGRIWCEVGRSVGTRIHVQLPTVGHRATDALEPRHTAITR